MTPTRIPWWQYLCVALIGAALYLPTLSHQLYTHDGWNDVLLGELVLSGGLNWSENLLRLIPTLSFGLRSYFELSTWAWHLPNIVLHGANAALIVALAHRIQPQLWAALLSGIFFALSPLFVHPVEWVGGSYDLFATAGVLGCLVAILDRRPLIAALAAIVALLSKESGLTLPVLAALAIVAAEGIPNTRAKCYAQIKRLAPIVVLSVICLLVRLAQISGAEHDALAGRSPTLDWAALFTEGIPAVGSAAIAVLSEILEVRENAAWLGWVVVVGLSISAILLPKQKRPILSLLIASWAALIPVMLIGMDHSLMLENPRYLYLSAALASPLLPSLLALERIPIRMALTIAAVVAGLGAYHTVDGIEKTGRQSAAVTPLVEQLSIQPSGTRVWVFSDFYDEASARFLMSRWLNNKRGVSVRYVMRGTGVVYQRGRASSDAAQSYFGPGKKFEPNMLQPTDRLFVHQATVGVLSPTSIATLPRTGPWITVLGAVKAAPPADPEDEAVILNGNKIEVSRFMGPIFGMELHPHVNVTEISGRPPLTGIEITYTAQTRGNTRYGSGYHELWAAFMWGPADARQALSFEIIANGQSQQVQLDLSHDPGAQRTIPQQLSLIALNYPGTLAIERIRIRR